MSIFKGSFHQNIRNQLTKRQEAINNRTPQNLTYYNSRNAWIRMISAVDVGGDGGALAKKYIMQGGILNPSGKLRSGLGQDGAYSNVSPNGMPYGQVNGKLAVAGAAGIRPMPGITGIEIKTKSAYGSLREVTVNFNAWTIQQLEDLELLYMRPGYTAMVEWGWSPYLNNSGTLVNNVSFIDDVLNGGKTKEKIWKTIFTKASTDGNYDAIYGFIKNYGWSARMDGGYDCTVTLITMGELLESLKINYTAAASNVIKKGTFSEESITKPFGPESPMAKSYGQNLLAGICNEMYEIASKTLTEKNTEENITLNGESYTFCRFDVVIDGRDDTEDTFLDNSSQIYITLESLCRVLNKYVTLQDGSGKTAMVNLSTKEGDYTDNPGANLLCLGDIYQLSTDPSICLIKNDAWKDPASLGFEEGFSDDFSTIKDLMTGLKTSYWYNDIYSISSGLGVIGNIFVNLGYIYSLITNDELASQDKKEKKEIVLYDFIKNILKGVNGSIGNVATLELFIDPIDSVARIIDVNYVDSKKRLEAYDDAFTLQMHNLNSTVRSYKLESQIFPEQSTIVAIGAQVKGGALGTNTNTLIDFNQNLIDRIVKSKDDPTTPPTTDPNAEAAELETKIKNLKENIDIIVSYLNEVDADWWESVGDFDVANASKYANALRDIINFKKEFVADDSKNRSIIPTKLSIEMDGIGGLIIGTMFKIPDDLLPRGYKGGGGVGPAKITYLVTGIGHSVQNNDWVTKLDAQFNILDEPKGIDATKYSNILAEIVKITSETEVKEATEKVKKKIDETKKGGGVPPVISANFNITALWMYFTHQQGSDGASQHYNVAYKNGKYKANVPLKNIKDNWPGGKTSSSGVKASDLSTLYKTDQKKLALAFIDVWTQRMNDNRVVLKTLKGNNRTGYAYSSIKDIFDQVGDSQITGDVLYQFAYIENGLQMDTNNPTYKGMFQLSQDYYTAFNNKFKEGEGHKPGFIKYGQNNFLKYMKELFPSIKSNFARFVKSSGYPN